MPPTVAQLERIADPARRARAAHDAIAEYQAEIREIVTLRAQALRDAYAAGTAWAELAREFGVHPSRIIELSKR
jgi:hypothetical protein